MGVTFRCAAVKSRALVWRSVVARPSVRIINSISATAAVTIARIPLSFPVSWPKGRPVKRKSKFKVQQLRTFFVFNSWHTLMTYPGAWHNVIKYLLSTMDCVLGLKTGEITFYHTFYGSSTNTLGKRRQMHYLSSLSLGG